MINKCLDLLQEDFDKYNVDYRRIDSHTIQLANGTSINDNHEVHYLGTIIRVQTTHYFTFDGRLLYFHLAKDGPFASREKNNDINNRIGAPAICAIPILEMYND